MTVNWEKDELNDHLSDLLDKMVKIAMDDNRVDSDEREIIDTIRQQLLNTEEKFEEMIENNLSAEEMEEETREIFEGIIREATSKAKADQTITDEELVIIDRLAKSLRNEDLSKYFKE